MATRPAEARGQDKEEQGNPPNEGVRKHVSHNKDTHEEVAERIHIGEGLQEREDIDRVSIVASACRSWGRCPPVLEMVARRAVLALSAQWGSGRFSGRRPWMRRVLRERPCTSASWATDGTRVAALSSSRALREHSR